MSDIALTRVRRRLERVAALGVAGVLASAFVVAISPPALSDTGAASQNLDFVGFVHDTDLVAPDGSNSSIGDQVNVVGIDGGQSVLFDSTKRVVYQLDDSTLKPTGTPIATKFPPLSDQHPGAQLVDPALHRIYIGRAPNTDPSSTCFLEALSCTNGSPLAAPTSLASVDLTTGTTTVVTFPAAADGYNVIGLTTTTTPDGRHLLFAMLLLNPVPSGEYLSGQGVQLWAIDADAIGTKADPTLWSYTVPQCQSTPEWSVRSTQDFLGIDPAGRYAYFACRGLDDTSSLDTEQPPGAIVVDFPSAFPGSASGFHTTLYPYGAQTAFAVSGGDQPHGLLYLASTGSPDKVYVFDAVHRAWTGSVPFDPGDHGSDLEAVLPDPTTGNVYGIYPKSYAVSFQATDVPVDQGSTLGYGDIYPTSFGTAAFDPGTHRLLLSAGPTAFGHSNGDPYPNDDQIAVFQDDRPAPATDSPPDPDAETHDVAITPDTPVSYRGFASGFGTKLSLVGGIHSTPAYTVQVGNSPGLAGVAGELCKLSQNNFCLGVPSLNDGTRTATFADVPESEVSNSTSKADASQITLDTTTNNDAAALRSYNPFDLFGPMEPDGTPPPPALPDQVTQGENQAVAPVDQQQAPAQCLDLGAKPSTTSSNGATAACDAGQRKTAADTATPNQLGDSPIRIGYSGVAVSSTETGGAVETVATAAARGISIAVPGGPTVSIGEVLTTAKSVAGGRPGTAASVFQRQISDVKVVAPDGSVAYSCGFSDQCDPRQLTDVVTSLSEFPVVFLTPSPDGRQNVTGSPGGAQAEVIKDQYQYWNDYFTNNDTGVEVPGLEVLMIADEHQPSRLVMQFAGLHVESHYAIDLLPPPPPPLPNPTLALNLVNGATPPIPLAGGEFELQGQDGSTVSTCTTAADGIGSCAFKDVTPGNYTIHESKAPPGYAPAPDYPTALEPGQDYKVTFVNLLAIGAVHVSLTSAVDKKPLSGAVFAMYAGKSSLGTPIATCTTGKDGTCGFTKVPLASYTMHQQSAPKGFLISKDVAFDLTDPGQDATLTFVDGTPAVKAEKGRFIPGKPAVPPHTEVVGGGSGLPAIPAAYSTPDIPPVVSSAPTDQAPLVAGLPQRLANLPAQLAKLLTHSPQQAVLLLFMWLVFGLPLYLWTRRRQLLTAVEGT